MFLPDCTLAFRGIFSSENTRDKQNRTTTKRESDLLVTSMITD